MTDDDGRPSWSQRVARLREQLNITQGQLAQLLRVSLPTVCNWENGRRAGAGRSRGDLSFHEELIELVERAGRHVGWERLRAAMAAAKGHIDLARRVHVLAHVKRDDDVPGGVDEETTQPDLDIEAISRTNNDS